MKKEVFKIEIQVALIAAGSAILGSIAPQIIALFTNKRQFINEMRKEYKSEKVKAYNHLSEIIISMWKSSDDKYWTNKAIVSLEHFITAYGAWLEDEEIKEIIKLQDKLENQSLKGNEDPNDPTLWQTVDRLQDTCRRKIRKEFFMQDNTSIFKRHQL